MVASHIQAPNPQDVEGALRALQEKRMQQGRAVREANNTAQNESSDLGHDTYWSPSIVPPEPAIDPTEEINPEGIVSNKPSPGRRVFRAIVGSVIIAVVASFAWQAYSDDQAKNIVKSWWSSVHGLKTQRGSELAANNPAPLPDQTVAVSPPAPTTVLAEAPPELMQQLKTIANDLAVLQKTVEELAKKQDQTSRDITSVQSAQQSISQQISSLARATAVRAATQKNVSKPAHSQTPQPSTVAGSAPPPARPPLPVPSPTQSPAN